MTRERTPLGPGGLGRDAERLDVLLGGRASALPPEASGDAFSKIVLYFGDGSNAQFFDVNDSGLAASIAAVTGTDTIAIPPAADATFTSAITIPANTAVQGTGTQTTFISAKVTMSSNSFLRDVTVKISANSGANLTGVAGPSDTGTSGYMNTVSIQITQAGAGDAYGVEMGSGDIFARSCFMRGNSTGGTGNGIKSGAGNIHIEEGTAVQGSTAAISGTNTLSIDSDKFIRLEDITGTYNWIFSFDETGLTAALTASASGDTIHLPTGTITLTSAITIAAGVIVKGAGGRANSIITATADCGQDLITVNNGHLDDVNVVYNTDLGAYTTIRAVYMNAGTVVRSLIECTNAGTDGAVGIWQDSSSSTGQNSILAINTGTGNAFGVVLHDNAATLKFSRCYAEVDDGGASGYGIYILDGTTSIVEWCDAIAAGAAGSREGFVVAGSKAGFARFVRCEGITFDMTVGAGSTLNIYCCKYDTFSNAGTMTFEKGDRTNEGAHVYNSGAISINDSTSTALTFDSERTDNDSIHSTGANTNRLTCITTGQYSIWGNVSWAADAVGGRLIFFRLNGTTSIAATSKSADAGTAYMDLSCEYQLVEGDYVEFLVWQNSTGALNINASGNFSPEFAMNRIGN